MPWIGDIVHVYLPSITKSLGSIPSKTHTHTLQKDLNYDPLADESINKLW